ncbi:MAG: hypothetical protein J5627_00925 [Bacilli bacterium]|nr:hypothetical protein [Bacilli bacterium]
MRKRILLPLFFFVSLCGCASENVSAIDHYLAERKLKNYDQFVNDEKFKAPETLKLKSKVDELSFHEKNLTGAEIELQIDTRYASGLEKETFPYAHFIISGIDEQAHKYAYENWVFVEARTTGNVVNVYERGTELKNIRYEYVFESKRDWADKAIDGLTIMDNEIHGSANRVFAILEEKGKAETIESESYDEPSAGGLSGYMSFLNDSLMKEEISFKFENYILQSYKHKKGQYSNESEAKWDAESIVKDTPPAGDFALQNEGGLTKAIR